MTIPAYPLQWPAGWKRTEPQCRTRARFGKQRTVRSSYSDYSYKQRSEVTIAEAVSRIRAELGRMGIDDDDLVISTNLQLRLMDVSGDAVTLGAAMNHAALNTANALGAWLGGVVIAAGYGYRSPALVGAALSVLGIGILVWSALSDRRDR